ncbi:MAG TPA: UDP-N-acetylmuramoyl-tripeptide--D-alanyl-D-alanine ligase [Planctomycetota bacterium]|nr:UDP-N-acetylmuramoyl-tripeptide--D-alanyl-D-alanine ligase [Planctomycetota bacterium]
MIPVPVAEIAAALGAPAPTDGARAATGLAVDSRCVKPGDVFLARRGEKDDGRKYVPQALAAGASLVIAEDGVPPHPRVVLVRDGIDALQRLAALVRSKYRGPLVAVGGSAGKTSTKNMLAALLGADRPVVASEKSFNNHAGVPMTLCRLEPDTAAAVVEIGSNHPGEIAPLAALARPDVAVVVAVGEEHLEGFGDLAGVLREELALVEALPSGGRAFVNGDDPVLAGATFPAHVRATRCGFSPDCDVRAIPVTRPDGAPAFRLRPNGPTIAAPAFPFSFARSNLLLAAVVARELGVPEEAIAAAAPALKPSELRGEVRRCRAATVWVDCYNANPLSAGAALAELARVDGPRRAVLGDMLELGAAAAERHEALGRQAAAAGVGEAVFVGRHGEDFRRGFGSGALTLRADAAAATDDFRRLTGSPGVVLLKASRGVGLERVLEVCA